jgi:branched-chain amino acid transport system substrate-binding protein
MTHTLSRTARLTLATLALSCIAGLSHAQQAKLKVGLMLPYSGTYTALGAAIENGFKLNVEQQGGKLGGREIEYVKVDDESDPAKATDNVNKLIKRDNVDVIVGTVHSGVAMAMAKAAKESGTVLIVPNAGADAVTGPMCAQNIFRSSFSNWQPAFAMGEVAAKQEKKKTAITITWKYAAGDESVNGFKEGFEKAGGQVTKQLNVPFPNVEFQALLTEIAAAKPDAVYAFFAGGGAVKFVKDYAAAGLDKTIPLYGPGFLTDGTLDAQGAAAQGMLTTLHYADGLNTPRDTAFRTAYAKSFKLQPDVYAVQGFDAAQMLGIGLAAVKGDITKKAEFAAAIEKAKIDSPRGPFSVGKSHNPVQDIYLRKVDGKENKLVSIASKSLADPARGCRM